MSSKQFQAGKPIEARQPIHQSHTDLQKNQDEEYKRAFTPLILPLIQRAAQTPQSITPAEAAYLQRTVGNQAIGRMLRVQAKLTLGPVGDKYEQEADTVAKQVVQSINAPKPQVVQRQEEDDELQMQPQPSLTISTLQRQEDEEELQAKPFTLNLPHLPFLQRQEEDEELQMKPSSTMEGGEISADIEDGIQRAKGGGRPLADHIRTPMERGFNTDFSNVKIHIGSQPNQLNQSIQARAFTTGRDIFFRDGAYNPNSSSGQELLAHELTHVVQQNGGYAQRNLIEKIGKTKRPAVQRLWNPFKKKSNRIFYLNHEEDSDGFPFIPDNKKKDTIYINLDTAVYGISPKQYDKADKDDLIKAKIKITGKYLKGKLKKKYLVSHVQDTSTPEPQVEEVDVESEQEDSTENSHELIVAVARENPYYLEYQKQRLVLTIKNKLNQFFGWIGKAVGKTPTILDSDDLKEKAARTAVTTRDNSTNNKGEEKVDESRVEKEVQKLLDNGRAMGHTWIKLRERTGKLLKKWSFGFWPGDRLNHPNKSIAGFVESPDEKHESKANEERLDMSYAVSKKQFDKALNKATERRSSPPLYKMTGYNCTEFAREIATTAGVAFPGKATVMPWVGNVYTPNDAYEAIEKLKKETLSNNSELESNENSTPSKIDVSDIESEGREEVAPIHNIQTLTPSDDPIIFTGLDEYELDSINEPTEIEILDHTYPDEMEGWEQVKVKNLNTGEVGRIDYTDLQTYLS